MIGCEWPARGHELVQEHAKRPNVGALVDVGLEFQRNLRQSIRSETISPQPEVQTDFNISSDRHAVFAADEWQLTPSVLLNIGARADRRIDGQMTTSPRLARRAPSISWRLLVSLEKAPG